MKITPKQQFWLDHVQKAIKSGLSYVDYANREAINLKALYNWKSLLDKKGLINNEQPSVSPFVTVKQSPLAVISRNKNKDIVLTVDIALPNGIHIHCQALNQDVLQLLAAL